MKHKMWWGLAAAVALFASAAFVACSDSDSGNDEADQQAVIDLMTTLAQTNGEGATQDQIDFYMAHITDAFLQDFGTESIAACEADAATCIGEPLTNVTIDPETVEVDGDAATLVIAADEASFGVRLIEDGDVWKANALFVPDDEIADGTDVVDLSLTEFSFTGDLESDAVKSGDFALHVTNDGGQNHEVVLVALPDDRPIAELLQDDSFQPEPIFVRFSYSPDDESDIALDAPLTAGRYAFVCFLPDTTDEEMTPHAFKGMVADFTVE